MITIPRNGNLLDPGFHQGTIESAEVGQLDSGTQFLQLIISVGKTQISKRFFFTLDYQCSNCRATFDKPVDTCPHCRNKQIYEPYYWIIKRLFKNLGIAPTGKKNGNESYDESALIGKKILVLLYWNGSDYLEIFNLLKAKADKTSRARLMVKLENYLSKKNPANADTQEPVEAPPF